MENPTGERRFPRIAKASRERVFHAANEDLRIGRRPTIEAIQTRLGGGSPNGIQSYLKEWYVQLGERLAIAEAPAAGLTPEVHRAALLLQASIARHAASGPSAESAELLVRSLRAEVSSLQYLLDELRSQRGRDQQLLADARALLVRRHDDLQASMASESALKAALAVAQDRLRRRAAGSSTATRPRKATVGPRGATAASRGRSAPTRKSKLRGNSASRAKRIAKRGMNTSHKAPQRQQAPVLRRGRSK